MHRTLASAGFAALLSLVLSVTAFAAPPEPEAGGSGEGSVRRADLPLYNALDAATDAAMEVFGPDDTCPRNVTVPALVIPVVDRGALVAYAFITPRLCLARGANENRLRDDLHFVVDRMVRSSHAHPFVITEGELDRSETHAAIFASVSEIAGEGRIERLDLLGSDLRFLNQ